MSRDRIIFVPEGGYTISWNSYDEGPGAFTAKGTLDGLEELTSYADPSYPYPYLQRGNVSIVNYSEDFEDGDISDWYVDASDNPNQIALVPKITGNYSLKIQNDSGNYAECSSPEGAGGNTLSFKFRLENLGDDCVPYISIVTDGMWLMDIGLRVDTDLDPGRPIELYSRSDGDYIYPTVPWFEEGETYTFTGIFAPTLPFLTFSITRDSDGQAIVTEHTYNCGTAGVQVTSLYMYVDDWSEVSNSALYLDDISFISQGLASSGTWTVDIDLSERRTFVGGFVGASLSRGIGYSGYANIAISRDGGNTFSEFKDGLPILSEATLVDLTNYIAAGADTKNMVVRFIVTLSCTFGPSSGPYCYMFQYEFNLL